jgi:tRNA threonylcarbamoyladenosine biosynthesis protein TsaE
MDTLMASTQNRSSATGVVTAETADDMRRLGILLGQAMDVGDVLALTGPLGSGKTTFAQGLAHGLGVAADRHVASPSFALVNEHPGRTPFVHVDFYRIRSASELPELGLEEAYDRAATAIEWAERFLDTLPADHLHITFTVQETGGRRLELQATGARGQKLAKVLDPTATAIT